jgi:hypothetical protein
MGIKLEVGKRYRDGYGKPRAIVMRFSASVYMAHDGAKYSDTGKRLVEYEYDSRFDLIALAPDEAPEPQPDELAALRARLEASEKYADGLAGTLLETRKTRDALHAENARLREAACKTVFDIRAQRHIADEYAAYCGHETATSVWKIQNRHFADYADELEAALTAKEPAR